MDDPAIRDIYAEESRELLDEMEGLLNRMGREPDAAADLYRTVHTLKGASAVVGLDSVSAFCRELESILESQPAGACSREFIALFSDARSHLAYLVALALDDRPLERHVREHGMRLVQRLRTCGRAVA